MHLSFSQKDEKIPETTALLGEVSPAYLPAAYIQTGTAEGVLTANTNGDINLSSVPGRMLVFCPWQFSSQKCLCCCIGDSNKFSDVLGMYRSWTKCNFTDMHEVTSELIHPSKLDFSSLSASLLPLRSVCTASLQGQIHCLLKLKPPNVLPVRQSRPTCPSSPGDCKYCVERLNTPPWHIQTG